LLLQQLSETRKMKFPHNYSRTETDYSQYEHPGKHYFEGS